MKKGNASNAKLNGEYAFHVRKFEKRHTAHVRRMVEKEELIEKLKEVENAIGKVIRINSISS